jgi:hypothetical protein
MERRFDVPPSERIMQSGMALVINRIEQSARSIKVEP